MVFSQTSLKTQSILKVVDLDRLKPGKIQQANGFGSKSGVVINGNTVSQTTPTTPNNYPEKYLKPEPTFESTMFHDSDSEFFQELVQWCSAPAKEEQPPAIDSRKKLEERAHNFDTPHTTFSPQGWDALDVNSPYGQTELYSSTPINTLSPVDEVQLPEQFLDISALPVVIGDLMSATVSDTAAWKNPQPVEWTNTHTTDYNTVYTDTYKTLPLIEEDSLDAKFVSVIPNEMESDNIELSDFIMNNDRSEEFVQQDLKAQSKARQLSVDVVAHATGWPNDSISTPDVLSYVEQLEKEKCPLSILDTTNDSAIQETVSEFLNNGQVDYEPITPKSESHVESEYEDKKSPRSKRKHQDSDDSDETYIPYVEQAPRKYKRRKPNVPIKDMILALEGSQQLTKARRGRPPKRRDSVLSSTCSIDESTSNVSTQEMKYRDLRDKNNEASKRSRMNRKLKELQMEQLAIELEEKNQKLKVQAGILEEMTKKLKDALMTAMLQK